MATNKRVLGRIGFYLGLALFLIITMLMTSFKSAKEAISLHRPFCRRSGRYSTTSTSLTR